MGLVSLHLFAWQVGNGNKLRQEIQLALHEAGLSRSTARRGGVQVTSSVPPVRPEALGVYDLTCMNCSRTSGVSLSRTMYQKLLTGAVISVVLNGMIERVSLRTLRQCRECGGFVIIEASLLLPAREKRYQIKTPSSAQVRRMPNQAGV